jgi:hypothetical protein
MVAKDAAAAAATTTMSRNITIFYPSTHGYRLLTGHSAVLLPQVIGSAIALLLLSRGAVPLWAGVLLSVTFSFIMLLVERWGITKLEALFGILIGVMVCSFAVSSNAVSQARCAGISFSLRSPELAPKGLPCRLVGALASAHQLHYAAGGAVGHHKTGSGLLGRHGLQLYSKQTGLPHLIFDFRDCCIACRSWSMNRIACRMPHALLQSVGSSMQCSR